MTKFREELTVEDLISVTKAVRILRPHMAESVCVGIEVPQVGDKNVIFHMRGPSNETGKREENVVMISSDFILEMFGGTGNVADRGV